MKIPELPAIKIRNFVAAQWRRLLAQKWFDVSLQTKMGLLVSAGLIGMMAIFTMMGIATARQATRQVLDERITLARLSATLLDTRLSNIMKILVLPAGEEILLKPDATPEEYASALQGLSSQTRGIFLLDLSGKVLYSASSVEYSIRTFAPDWQAMPAFQEILYGHPSGITVLEPHTQSGISNLNHSWVAIMAPVRDEKRRLVHILAGVVDLAGPEFQSSWEAVNLANSGQVDLVDAHGHVLLSTARKPSSDNATNPELAPLVNQFFNAGQPGAATCIGCYGSEASAQDEVIGFAPLSQVPLGVVVRQRAAETFAPVRRLTMWNLGLGLLSVAGALVLVRVTTNSVIAPVQELTRASRRIAEGELYGACELPGNLSSIAAKPRRDEIGILAESFGVMCQRLKQSMDEIQAWNRELDSRVQARTREALAAQQEAQEARDDLRAIIDALSDDLVVVDIATDQILQLNKAAQENYRRKSTRVPETQLIGQPCCAVLHNGKPCKPPECECPRELIRQTGISVKVTHIHVDPESGAERYIDIVASPLRNTNGQITRIVELMRDVTEERRIRESLVRKNQQLSILNSIANTVNQSLDLEQILGRTLEEVLRLTDIDIGAVFLQRDVLGSLELVAYRGLSRETALLAAQMGLLDGSCGGVLEKGQIVIVPDLRRYRGRRARALRKENLNTLVHVPLTAKGFTLGSMCIGTCEPREFTPEDQELLKAIGNQIAVAIENARLFAEVQHKEQIRGELFKSTINAQEDERKRIARDLHDDTSQALAALIYSTEEILEMSNLSEIRERLIDVRDLAQHTLDGVHKVIFDLRPTMLDHLGLVPALRWLAKSWLEPRGIRTNIEVNSDQRRLPPELETAIFRVLQEAIINIARHSAARNVLVWLRFRDYHIHIGVEDDGVGFDLANASDGQDQVRGLGLLGMEERIALLGGELEINSAPGNGTQIHLRVPLPDGNLEYA